MAETGQETSLILRHVQGVPLYKRNPSVPGQGMQTRTRKRRIGDDHKGMVINTGTGEILGAGGAVAYEFEEVDQERFVKLFLDGLKQAAGLSKAGLMIFEIIYNQMRHSPNTDEVKLNFFSAKEAIPDLTERTYRRGIRELLDKEFLYRSAYEGLFFVNIRYMFNGDRLAFVKAYKMKGSTSSDRQLSLLPPDDETPD